MAISIQPPLEPLCMASGALRPRAWALRTGAPRIDTLGRVYYYALWLGEAHTPLSAVLDALARTDATVSTGLFVSPASLRTKYQDAFAAVCTRTGLLDNGSEVFSTTSADESAALAAAVTYGPLRRAVHAHREDTRAATQAVRVFIAAIHCREYVLVYTLTQGTTAAACAVLAAPARRRSCRSNGRCALRSTASAAC